MSSLPACFDQPAWLPIPPGESDPMATSATLLKHLTDWRDHPAWAEFHDKYDPMLRLWCRRYDFDTHTVDDLCQRIWIELMVKMRIFCYDPTRSFRGWLYQFFTSRAIDLIRQRASRKHRVSGGFALDDYQETWTEDEKADDEGSTRVLLLSQLGELVQERARARVTPDNWMAFERIALHGQSIKEVASSLGKSYTATYTAYKRVDRILKQEGQKQLAGFTRASSSRA